MSRKPGYKNPNAGRPKIPVITQCIGELEGKLPQKPIVLEEVLYWMDLGGSREEIAGHFRVSGETLAKRLKEETGMNFLELKERCCGGAKLKLRKNQFRMSEKNASMAIWLGKIWLGQRDIQEEEHAKEVLERFGSVANWILNKQIEAKQEEVDKKTETT